MADLTGFRPQLVTNQPKDTQDFLKHFNGNKVLSFLHETKPPLNSLINPNDGEWKQIGGWNASDYNIYFTVNETDGLGRKLENVTAARAVFADDDIPRTEPRTDWALPPSLIVQSSTGKYHYYWLTTTTDLDEWTRVQKGIIGMYGTDKSIHDPTRILRLPGFTNAKAKPQSMCTLVDGNGQRYSWATVTAKFPPVSVEKANVQAGKSASGEFNEIELMARFAKPLESGWITDSMRDLIMHWAHHYSDNKIKQKIEQMYEALTDEVREEHGERYMAFQQQVPKTIKTARRKVNMLREVVYQGANVKVLRPDVPESLEWNWSLLKSNPIPEDSIPDTMLQAAKEIGEWTATGQDPAILSAVFITSALLSKNVIIHEIGDNLTTHCQSGICIVMDTGARKTSIYEQMNKPFFDFEERLQEGWEENKFTNESMVKALDSQIKRLDKAYEKATAPSPGETLSYANNRGDILKQIDKIQIKKPWLRSSDLTEQKLIRKLKENDECIAAISDDARPIINNILGKHDKEGSTGEAIYINALTGSSILYERVGSDIEIDIKRPVLNALLFVQPDSALRLRNSEMFVPSGLAARLPMYFYPVSGIDIVEQTERRSINESVMNPYYTALRNICVRRIDNPLHIRLDEAGMAACSRMDKKFAELLKNEWRGHYDKSNKIVTLTIMYATCFAALEDPQFAMSFRDTEIEDNTYTLPVKYLNMATMFANSLFGQSITSHTMLVYESLPRKAESFLSTLQKWYGAGKITEGFVICGAFNNQVSVALREFMGEIVDMLVDKKWLYTTVMTDDKRKLNNGFPDKLVDTGDLIYHLNIEGIKKREELGLAALENALLAGDKK